MTAPTPWRRRDEISAKSDGLMDGRTDDDGRGFEAVCDELSAHGSSSGLCCGWRMRLGTRLESEVLTD